MLSKKITLFLLNDITGSSWLKFLIFENLYFDDFFNNPSKLYWPSLFVRFLKVLFFFVFEIRFKLMFVFNSLPKAFWSSKIFSNFFSSNFSKSCVVQNLEFLFKEQPEKKKITKIKQIILLT